MHAYGLSKIYPEKNISGDGDDVKQHKIKELVAVSYNFLY